ncbi:P-II family nitrogen regulator [Desulfuromonas carbonis]|uniref:P-II family nitrogen regulator n=1 Tax=Desulfuromonas sp. DDH964 TaxID=1823759 RepID=UPI00078E3955|nr:P-II family nitrogen regulator [Desulfuromonas sp. DDH964]AMV72252.1 nitrogen regulatory protein P-II [Desulfuromonas sp. DDH964]
MKWKRIVAIIRGSVLEQVEDRLKQLGVRGITVSQVKGYGEYANLCKGDWLVSNARIEIFSQQSQVDGVVAAILEAAHAGVPGDGLVAVMPVEKLYRIRTKAEIAPGEV